MIVKVCGVRTAAIATAALDAGADWIGVVREPRSVRHATDEQVREVAAAVGRRGTLVAVMVSPSLADCTWAADAGAGAVQAHGVVDPTLVTAAPLPLIPAINQPAAGVPDHERWWPDCLVLLDAPVDGEELPGGTGRSVDLGRAAALAHHRPFVLAGGLGPDTVAAAIATVRPAGVDASSGLESSPGIKDAARVVAYVHAARAAAVRS